jgi:predicted metal-dependent HD superfamily phosphohydrolase
MTDTLERSADPALNSSSGPAMHPSKLDDLQARFRRAAADAGATEPCGAVFQELASRYAEAHRRYHTLTHVGACLVWLDWFSGSAAHAEEVELALWFHDAVYDPGDSSNERRSAQLARDRLSALGVRAEAVERIAAFIEATARHEANGGDTALVVDLDLTVLGAGRREFDAFEHRIRLEYAHVPESIYREARRRVLEGFVSRGQVYETLPLRSEFEAPARANLARRIRELSAVGGPV